MLRFPRPYVYWVIGRCGSLQTASVAIDAVHFIHRILRGYAAKGVGMGTVITVMNMKGGVGKTTVTMNLAGILSRYHINGKKPTRKVLAIDYDPQFNLSQAFLKAKAYFALEAGKKTTLSILVDDGSNLNPYEIQVPGNANPPKVADLVAPIYSLAGGGCLHLVPSTLDLMYVALGQTTSQLKPLEERFSKFIAESKALYDVVLIDCHPAGSIFTKTSLNNSDHVLIPVMPQRYATRGIGLMMQFIAAKKHGTAGPTPHILFNGVPRQGVAMEEAQIRSNPHFAAKCLTATLKKFKAFSDPEEGAGFVWSSGAPYSSEARSNLIHVASELMTRVGA